jgi:hypothetical protein
MNEEIYQAQLDYILEQYEFMFLETAMRLKWKMLGGDHGMDCD